MQIKNSIRTATVIFVILTVITAAFYPLFRTSERAEAADTEGFFLRNNCAVEFCYSSYSLGNGSVYRGITVTFDIRFINDINEAHSNSNSNISVKELLEYIKVELDSIGYVSSIDMSGKVSSSVKFDSVTDLYIAYGITGYENDSGSDYETKKGFFFNDITVTQDSVFSDIETNESSIFNVLYSLVLDCGVSRDEVSLVYQYGTPYQIVKTNAGKTFYDSESRTYFHEFRMNVDTATEKIVLTQHSPNSLGWYLVAIAVAAFIAAIAIFRAYARSKRMNKLS